ncbi:AAA family ATPase [Brachyspira alvinipulli]|uniref:AAA family ATPase n=1 Tax=Brachyspira alvinipulli TaxID=84379 RepID=UPI00048212DC|nr:AAA family ATPase [Brachyspira alvinipulli]
MTQLKKYKKIALYGVSSSGKSYLINKLIEYDDNFYHCAGSEFLFDISKKRDFSFSKLDNEQKNIYRKKFIEYADNIYKNNSKHIIVDAHYAFYKNDNFEIARIKEDLYFYDIFLYLDTDTNIIYNRALARNEEYKKADCSIENIDKLKKYEKEHLEEELNALGKELIIINDDNTDNIINCIHEYIDNSIFDVKNNVTSFLNDNTQLLNKYDNIILSDCDRTLSIYDTSVSLFKELGIDFGITKKIFKNNNYSSFALYNFSSLISNIEYDKLLKACQKVSKNTELFIPLINEIESRKEDYFLIAVTSGIREIWDDILKNKDVLIVGWLHRNSCKYLVSKFFKSYLCRKLIDMGKNVTALGDSLIDYNMLINANRAFLNLMIR